MRSNINRDLGVVQGNFSALNQNISLNRDTITALEERTRQDREGFHQKLYTQDQERKSLEQRMHAGGGGNAPLPFPQPAVVASLPPPIPNNPWRLALVAPIHGEQIYFEGLGYRPISDFETHPVNTAPPHCYMRLNPEASVREDKVPREAGLLPKEEAQEVHVEGTSRSFLC